MTIGKGRDSPVFFRISGVLQGLFVGFLVGFLAVHFAGLPGSSGRAARAADPPAAGEESDDADGAASGEEAWDEGIFLPTDRQRQRQVDRAIRLLDDRRWSDAALLLDEILASDNDSFHETPARRRGPRDGEKGTAADRGQDRGSTWMSLKATADELIGSMDAEGREAYELQFRAKADRAMAQALADGSLDGVMAVARRWFHTPAGGRAAVLLAVRALETGQPSAAVAWLDRLAGSRHAEPLEPTLSVMRAIAWTRAGERDRAVAAIEKVRKGKKPDVRIAGRDVRIAYPSGGAEEWLAGIAGAPSRADEKSDAEWLMPGGGPARNAMSRGFRPLLAPRYRVSLARHPEEANQLEQHRRAMAEKEVPLLPAGQPLAASGRLIVHSMLGLLAVDFETGKRVWLQSGPYESGDDPFASDGTAADGEQLRSSERAFDDLTCGMLSSDGRLVFAIENPRQAYTENQGPQNFAAAATSISNTLSAYEIDGAGRLAWRLSGQPQAADDASPNEPAGDDRRSHSGWFLGPPLPVGQQLLVLVEEKGGIRLDVLDASSGSITWSQPLAELEDTRSIDKPAGRDRRLAGLSPSLAEGVLVCPTGAGAVVGVDIATRSLLWAYRYSQSEGTGGMVINGVAIQGMNIRRGAGGVMILQGNGERLPQRNRWLDGTPILADGRILLSPKESNELHCLDLRSGRLLWKIPRKPNICVAGVVDGRVILVGNHSVDAVSLASGERAWPATLELGTSSPSGRGCIARGRLFLPLDSPEVIEVDLERATIIGRSAARGGHAGFAANAAKNPVPGNLIAYRGEVVSQSASSLDVFHQTEPLEKAVETALSKNAEDPWALFWRGQLLLDQGRVVDGIAAIESAHRSAPRRIPQDAVSAAILFSLGRDFPAASAFWPRGVDLARDPSTKLSILRTAIDGFLADARPSEAWSAYRRLAFDDIASEELMVDPSDPSVACVERRWMSGRLQDLLGERGRATKPAQLSQDLRKQIDAAMDELLDRAIDSDDSVAAIERFLDRAGGSPVAAADSTDDAAAESPRARARRLLVERLSASLPGSATDRARGGGLRKDLLMLSFILSEDAAARRLATDQVVARVPTPADGGGPDAEAWPVGSVKAERDDRHRGNPSAGHARAVRFVPVLGVGTDADVAADADATSAIARLGIPGLRLSFDAHAGNAIVASDAFGRRLGEPLALDDGTNRFNPFGGVQFSNYFDATVIGRVAVVRRAGQVAAFEIARDPAAGAAGNRRLWSMSGPHDTPMGGVIGGGMRRPGLGGIPLGARFVEPAGNGQRGLTTMKVGRATTAGVPIIVDRSLELRDVVTGGTLWTRHRVSSDDELIGDERFLTVLPRDGRGAVVLSMVDGRVERRCDLPPREARLCGSGRRIVVAEPAAGGHSGTTAISMIDPVTGTRTPLGEYPGDALVTPVGDSLLGVLETGGRFTLLDLTRGAMAFSRSLEGMPDGLKGLHILPWQDRLLVIASRNETQEEQDDIEQLGPVSPIPQAWNADDMSLIMTASIWSIDRSTGESLWPMPATVVRHGLQLSQPPGLPLLVFARHMHGRQGNERPRLGLLCIDKRTGHAVHENDRVPLEQHNLSSCEVSGDPSTRRIFIDIGTARTVLTFEGKPIPPRPPFQAAGVPSRSNDVWREIEQWMNRALQGMPF